MCQNKFHVEPLWEFKRRCGDWTPDETLTWLEEEVAGLEDGDDTANPLSEDSREEAEVWNLPESPGSFMYE